MSDQRPPTLDYHQPERRVYCLPNIGPTTRFMFGLYTGGVLQVIFDRVENFNEYENSALFSLAAYVAIAAIYGGVFKIGSGLRRAFTKSDAVERKPGITFSTGVMAFAVPAIAASIVDHIAHDDADHGSDVFLVGALTLTLISSWSVFRRTPRQLHQQPGPEGLGASS